MTSYHLTQPIKEEPLQADLPNVSDLCDTSNPPNASDPLVQIHQHLADVSQLVQNLYGNLRQHQSRYEQAYLSEQQKLQQNVAAYRTLELENERLARENRYCRDQLLPGYDNVLCRQAQENKECAARVLDLESKSREQIEEHRQTLDVMEGLLKEQDQKIEELKASNQARSEIQPEHCSPPPVTRKRQRPSKLTIKTGSQGGGASAKRVRTCRLARTNYTI